MIKVGGLTILDFKTHYAILKPGPKYTYYMISFTLNSRKTNLER